MELFRTLSFHFEGWFVPLVVMILQTVYVAGTVLLNVRVRYKKSLRAKVIVCRRPQRLEHCTFFEDEDVKILVAGEWIILTALMFIESWGGFSQLWVNLSSQNDDLLGAYSLGAFTIIVFSAMVVSSLDFLSFIMQGVIYAVLQIIRVLQVICLGICRGVRLVFYSVLTGIDTLVTSVCEYRERKAEEKRQKKEEQEKEAEAKRKEVETLKAMQYSPDNHGPVDSTARYVEDDSDYAYAQAEKTGTHYGNGNIISIRGRAE